MSEVDTIVAVAAALRDELTRGPSSLPLHAILGRLETLAGVTPVPVVAGPTAATAPVIPTSEPVINPGGPETVTEPEAEPTEATHRARRKALPEL